MDRLAVKNVCLVNSYYAQAAVAKLIEPAKEGTNDAPFPVRFNETKSPTVFVVRLMSALIGFVYLINKFVQLDTLPEPSSTRRNQYAPTHFKDNAEQNPALDHSLRLQPKACQTKKLLPPIFLSKKLSLFQ